METELLVETLFNVKFFCCCYFPERATAGGEVPSVPVPNWLPVRGETASGEPQTVNNI